MLAHLTMALLKLCTHRPTMHSEHARLQAPTYWEPWVPMQLPKNFSKALHPEAFDLQIPIHSDLIHIQI